MDRHCIIDNGWLLFHHRISQQYQKQFIIYTKNTQFICTTFNNHQQQYSVVFPVSPSLRNSQLNVDTIRKIPEYSIWLLLALEWSSPVSLRLVDVWFNGCARVIQCHIYIPIDLCDLVNPLFDTLGAPECFHGPGFGILHSLVKPLALCQRDLVFVPRTHDAQQPVELLLFTEHSRDQSEIETVVTKIARAANGNIHNNIQRKLRTSYFNVSIFQFTTWICRRKNTYIMSHSTAKIMLCNHSIHITLKQRIATLSLR